MNIIWLRKTLPIILKIGSINQDHNIHEELKTFKFMFYQLGSARPTGGMLI